jgi:hypothetical protein
MIREIKTQHFEDFEESSDLLRILKEVWGMPALLQTARCQNV